MHMGEKLDGPEPHGLSHACSYGSLAIAHSLAMFGWLVLERKTLRAQKKPIHFFIDLKRLMNLYFVNLKVVCEFLKNIHGFKKSSLI